jgi:hypothetical protein
MRRSHSPQRGLSAVACGGSGPLKFLLATGGATDRTPEGFGATVGVDAIIDDVPVKS